MSDRRPYSRVYWSVMDDPKFDTIRSNVAHMGAWLVLLLAADQAYPVPAYIPPIVPRKSLSALVDAGLVDVLPGHLYRVHGLDQERKNRAEAATRTGPKRDPVGTQAGPSWEAVGLQAETKQSKAETETSQAVRAGEDTADAYWSLTGRYPVGKVLTWIDQLMDQYGAEATTRALVTAHLADQTVATLLGRTTDLLRAEARALDRRERDEERERLRAKRAVPRELPAWEQEYRAAIAARYERSAA